MTFKELTNEGSYVAYCKEFCVIVKTCKQKSASEGTAFRVFECTHMHAHTHKHVTDPINRERHS